MCFINVTSEYLIKTHKRDMELVLPDTSNTTLKIFIVRDNPVGYICFDDIGKIWNVEIFLKYRGNNYCKIMIQSHIEDTGPGDYIVSPISEKLVLYYKNIGFVETSEYEDHLAEFPLMKFSYR